MIIKKGNSMKAEFDLLKKLAESSTTRYSEGFVYSLNNGVADLDDLMEGGYIRLEESIENDQKKRYYKITLKGWDFLNQQKERKLQIWATIIILILTFSGLMVSLLTYFTTFT